MGKDQLKKLLYRKSVCEQQMDIIMKGASIYDRLLSELKKDLENIPKGLSYFRHKADIMEVELKARNFATSYRQISKEYKGYLLPEISKIASEKEKKTIEFQDLSDTTKQMAELSVYGDTEMVPENVEHVEIIDLIKTHIELLTSEVEGLQKHATGDLSELELAETNRRIFDIQLMLLSNNKRLADRSKYYYEVFLPRYKKDMREAKKYKGVFLQRAAQLAEAGINSVGYAVILEQIEKHKNDKQNQWLTYISLRTQVQATIAEMKRTPNNFKGKMHLAKAIIK